MTLSIMMTLPITLTQILVFADLDDTLFQTLRKLKPQQQRGLSPATLNTVGQPHSFSTPAQATLLGWLDQPNVTLIPLTGRDSTAMQRVLLPFSSWQVMDHGLTMLEPPHLSGLTGNNNLHQPWAQQVHAALLPLQAELAELSQQIRLPAKQFGCRVTLHHAADLPFMTVIKHPDANPEALAQLQTLWQDLLIPNTSLKVIRNANNLSLLPKTIGKAEAVQYLRAFFPETALTLGLGDSISDLAFMQQCDFWLTPQAGQLARTLKVINLMQV